MLPAKDCKSNSSVSSSDISEEVLFIEKLLVNNSLKTEGSQTVNEKLVLRYL